MDKEAVLAVAQTWLRTAILKHKNNNTIAKPVVRDLLLLIVTKPTEKTQTAISSDYLKKV
jgi:hypothetical protein